MKMIDLFSAQLEREAAALILEDRREDGLRGVPPGAIRETVHLRHHGGHLKGEGGNHSLMSPA